MNENYGGLGRVVPKDLSHITRYPYSAVQPSEIFVLEKLLPLPVWHQRHNQGNEGACVGFGTSMMLSMLNLHECRAQGAKEPYIRYNPWWLWDRAKEVDEFDFTNPGDQQGTTVKAACQILKARGHVSWENEEDPTSIGPEMLTYGISAYRWATRIDEVRTALHHNIPLSIGVNWYSNFDKPEYFDGEWWIGRNPNMLGGMRGGHCVCVYGGSDQRQAVRIKNSWGSAYPEVWMPYATLERLIREHGEVVLITDI